MSGFFFPLRRLEGGGWMLEGAIIAVILILACMLNI